MLSLAVMNPIFNQSGEVASRDTQGRRSGSSDLDPLDTGRDNRGDRRDRDGKSSNRHRETRRENTFGGMDKDKGVILTRAQGKSPSPVSSSQLAPDPSQSSQSSRPHWFHLGLSLFCAQSAGLSKILPPAPTHISIQMSRTGTGTAQHSEPRTQHPAPRTQHPAPSNQPNPKRASDSISPHSPVPKLPTAW